MIADFVGRAIRGNLHSPNDTRRGVEGDGSGRSVGGAGGATGRRHLGLESRCLRLGV